MSPKKINPAFDLRITFFSLFPYMEQLAKIQSDAEFLITIEQLVRFKAPELISGNIDSLFNALIDYSKRRQHMGALEAYTKCRDRLRNFRSTRPETQLISPAHTEGKELEGMHDEIAAISNIKDLIEFANENPAIFEDQSLGELKNTAEITLNMDPFFRLGLLYSERLGLLQLLNGLQNEIIKNKTIIDKALQLGKSSKLPDKDKLMINQIMELMWLGAPAIFPFIEKHPELLKIEIIDLIKQASRYITDNNTRLVVTLRRVLFLLPKIKGEEVKLLDYVICEEGVFNRCDGILRDMIIMLTEERHREAVFDMIEFFIYDFPESKTDLTNYFHYYFPD